MQREDAYFTSFNVTSCWLELSSFIAAQEEELWSWVFAEKSRLFPSAFVMQFLLALSMYFCFSLNVLKETSFFMKMLSVKKNPSL